MNVDYKFKTVTDDGTTKTCVINYYEGQDEEKEYIDENGDLVTGPVYSRATLIKTETKEYVDKTMDEIRKLLNDEIANDYPEHEKLSEQTNEKV